MTAPNLYILLPLFIAAILSLLHKREKTMSLLAVTLALMLAAISWLLPIDSPISPGPASIFPIITIRESASAFGTLFILDDNSRPVLMMIYLSLGFWFIGAYATASNRLFNPVGFVIAALLTTCLAIEPKSYVAPLIGVVALFCIPLLSPPGSSKVRGVNRFLTFIALGVCCILFGDWLIPVGGIDPTNPQSVQQATLVLIIGFFMILAVFPFYSWMPMLSESAPPYSYGFVCFVLASLISFLLLDYLQRYMSLGVSEYLVTSYRLAGVVMVVIGGAWAVFEKHLGRILGFATMVQIGTSLMIISMMNGNEPAGAFSGPFFYHLMAFGISLALWSFALNVIKNQTANPTLAESQGLARKTPIAALGLVLANFSMAGLPLLASFPVYISLWSALAQKLPAYAILSFLGSACLLITGLRTLAVFASSQGDQAWILTERGLQPILILAASAMLLLLGLMPQWFFSVMANIGPNLTVISP